MVEGAATREAFHRVHLGHLKQQWPFLMFRRVKQSYNDPSSGMLMHRTNEEVRIILVDHLFFVSISKMRLPGVPIFAAPLPPRLCHFPVGTHDGMSGALVMLTLKFVLKFEGDFLKITFWRFQEEVALVQDVQLGLSPIGGIGSDYKSLDLSWPENPERRKSGFIALTN